MTIYKLEEDPNVFITPTYYGNKFVYRMSHIAKELSTRRLIRNIDLRSDKLMIYGTEIKESILQTLYDSLTLGQKLGHVYVNCNGACHFLLIGKGMCKPIHNVIFDWSSFGVILPNSTSASLKKQLDEKIKETDEMSRLLSALKCEMTSSNASLQASKEATELKEQLSTFTKERQEMEMKLRKVCDQLSLRDFELESYKIELESSKKEVKKLQEELSTSKIVSIDMASEWQKAQEKLSLSNSEVQSVNKMLELSKERVMELEEQLSTCKKELEDKAMEVQSMQDQLSSIKTKFQSTTMELKSSKNSVTELEYHLSSCKKKQEDILTTVQNLEDELNSTKNQLESSNKKVMELKEELFMHQMENQVTRGELEKVQGELSLANDELQSTKILLESSENKAHKFKDESCSCKTEHQRMEVELRRLSDHLLSVNSEARCTNRQLNQLHMTMLLNQLLLGYHFQSRLQRPVIVADPRVHRIHTENPSLFSEGDFDNARPMVANTDRIRNRPASNNSLIFIEIENVDE